MTSAADQVIAALRSGFDDLSAYVVKLDEKDLTGPSGASEWTVAQVLSHLGSGAEIAKAQLERAISGEAAPDGFNQSVWARWDAMGPVEQRDGFITANEAHIARYEGLDEATKGSLLIDLGFLPAPIPVSEAARMRLNEFALHSWDVRVAADPAAAVAPEAVPQLFGSVAGLMGWVAKPENLGGRTAEYAVTLTDPDRTLGLLIGGTVELTETPSSPDGTITMPSEAWLRLATGRLGADHTPASVSVTGPIGLDDLRKLFPGY